MKRVMSIILSVVMVVSVIGAAPASSARCDTKLRIAENASDETESDDGDKFRDVILQNGTNIEEKSYAKNNAFFNLGDHGLLTLSQSEDDYDDEDEDYYEDYDDSDDSYDGDDYSKKVSSVSDVKVKGRKHEEMFLEAYDDDDWDAYSAPYYMKEKRDDPAKTSTITYSGYDSSIININESEHTYTVVGSGITTVNLQGSVLGSNDKYTECSASICFICTADASGVDVESSKIKCYCVNDSHAYGEIKLTGDADLGKYVNVYTDGCKDAYLDEDGCVDYYDGDDSVYFAYNKDKNTVTVEVDGSGTMKVTMCINNKKIPLKITVKKCTFSSDSILVEKGKTKKIKLKGYSGNPGWKSLKSSIAKVSADGTIKGKKYGTTAVYLDLGDIRIGCAVSVVKKGIPKVVNKAVKIYKTCKYSQPKRMKKKFYDCSSLVWKAYKTIGKFIISKYYAPVAADMAKWCVKRKNSLGKYSYKKLNKLTYRPGDLGFPTGAKNGRYKGIYHVEMFTGYKLEYFDGKKAYYSATWASKPYGYDFTGIMGRPWK